MSSTIFYVRDSAKKGKLVAAKFFQYGGKPYADVNAEYARSFPIYNSSGKLLSEQNVHGYLIVPADFALENSVDFARLVSRTMTSSIEIPGGGEEGGLLTAAASMYGAFADGSQDAQRTYDGGAGKTAVLAFRDAASFNLGLVSAYSGIPISWANEGGGLFNRKSSIVGQILGRRPLDTSGVDGLARLNQNSIRAGYQFGSMLSGSAGYLPLHQVARAIGKAKKSVSVAPVGSVKRVSGWRGWVGLPAAAGGAAPIVAPQSGSVSGWAGKSSQITPRPSGDMELAAFRGRTLAALSSWRMGPDDALALVRTALARLGSVGGLASRAEGGLAEAVAAVRRGGSGAPGALGELAFVGTPAALTAWLPSAFAAPGKAAAGSPGTVAAWAVARTAGRREMLPSVAPVRKRLPRLPHEDVAVRRAMAPEAGEVSMSVMARDDLVDARDEESRFRRMLSNVLDREARLPPRGMTGFDPRVTPAWAGLKISV